MERTEKQIQYEIDAVKSCIMAKESKGRDASFERGLLKSWARYSGWKYAGQALKECGKAQRRK